MSEIEKMYELVNVEPQYKKRIECKEGHPLGKPCGKNPCIDCDKSVFKDVMPPFTAEKQLSLLKFCLKWGQLHILQGIDDEFRIENSCYRQGYQSTLEAAIANYINEKWEKLSEEEKQQVRGILE